ncbi:MAG: hypothetical protein K0S36_2096 [Nitrosospira multiformis]|nr:hypothetical protein [Nitrosospira multiformis]
MQTRDFGNRRPRDGRKTEPRSRVQEAIKSTHAHQCPINRARHNPEEGEGHPSTASSTEEKDNAEGIRLSVKALVDDLPLIPLEKSEFREQPVVAPQVAVNAPTLVLNRAERRRRKRFRTAPNPPDKTLLTDEEAAYVLDLGPDSLAVFRSTGRHQIPFIKIGRNVRYRRADLEAWLQARTCIDGVTRKEEL